MNCSDCPAIRSDSVAPQADACPLRIPVRNPRSLLTRGYRQWHKIALQNHLFLQPCFELALKVFLLFAADQVVEFIRIGLEIEQFKHGTRR